VKAADLAFAHVYRAGATPTAPTLLVLHGTGGDEHDLLPIAEALDPSAGVLSPRGRVLERGMPRFFRRLAEGVFDEDDVRRRAHELANFVGAAAERYAFDPRAVTAVGFSNGANIASAVLLVRPEVLSRAVLFRAMVPFVPDPAPSLSARVLVSNGRVDPIVSTMETERLVALLRGAGADVSLAWQQAGHELTQTDLVTARDWLNS
jgi:phospholipase/carboxylesterase